MISRKSLLVTVVLVFVVALLAGCGTEAVQVPDRDININMDAALAGQ